MTRPVSPLILAAGEIGSAIFWLLLIVALVVIGFVAVTWIKRWAAEPDDAPIGGFTLGDLRDLHKAGQMSDAEYEKAKAMIVDAAKAAAAKKAQQPNPPTPPSRLR